MLTDPSRRTLIAGALLSAVAARAQPAWPTRTVRWIVPFGAGGAADATARTIAQKLGERWGHQVVVDNKPGANTMIAAQEAMRAAPDGYTLFQPINSTLTLNPFTTSKLPYDPIRDFTHIALIASVPLIFVANDTLPAKTLQDMVALAKARPGTITTGGSSVGMQLANERFNRDARIKVTWVPYKSGIDVTKGLLSSEIQVGVDGIVAYIPHVKSGKLRALATNSQQRVASLPEVPTLAELGYHNSEAGVWHGVMAPAGLPREIQRKIEADLRVVLSMPDVKERMLALGLEPMWGTSEQFLKLIESESAVIGPLAREMGIKMD